MINVREACADDRRPIRQLHTLAFAGPEAERVARLAGDLLDEATATSLVAEDAGELVGHVAFSPVGFSDGCGLKGAILAPLGVRPTRQKQGIGRLLVEQGIERLRAAGGDLLLVYGDPAYYGRFGFTAQTAKRFAPPYPLQYPFGWQARRLSVREHGGTNTGVSCVGPLCDSALW